MNRNIDHHMKPIITKNPNGTITISIIIDNERYHRIYSGFSQKGALKHFKSEMSLN